MKLSVTKGGILVLPVALVLWFVPAALGASEAIPVLQTRMATYTNVTVTGRGKTNIYFRHDGGVASIRIGELGPETQQSLGYAETTAANDDGGAGSQASRILRRVETSTPFKKVRFANGVTFQVGAQEVQLNPSDIAGIAVCAVVGYLLFCYCSLLICKKTGNEPGILVWFPILQAFPLLRAAGMSGWWFLAFFIPVLNLAAWMGWCVNIVISRGKNLCWALLLILPVTNVLAFLYLALASAESAGEGPRVGLAERFAALRPNQSATARCRVRNV